MGKKTSVKTINDFICLVNKCKSARYEFGQGIDDNPEPLNATIYFDNAAWVYYPNTKSKRLVLSSNVAGKDKGYISIGEVKGVEVIRKGENGIAIAVIAGNKNEQSYVFYINT